MEKFALDNKNKPLSSDRRRKSTVRDRAREFWKWPADNATDETTRGGGVVHSREDDSARLLNFILLYNHDISTVYTHGVIIFIIIHAYTCSISLN